MNKRQLLSENDLLAAIKDVEDKLIFRAKQKGLGTMASNHEILGIIDDELQEYRDEVHAKSKDEKKINRAVLIGKAKKEAAARKDVPSKNAKLLLWRRPKLSRCLHQTGETL